MGSQGCAGIERADQLWQDKLDSYCQHSSVGATRTILGRYCIDGNKPLGPCRRKQEFGKPKMIPEFPYIHVADILSPSTAGALRVSWQAYHRWQGL